MFKRSRRDSGIDGAPVRICTLNVERCTLKVSVNVQLSTLNLQRCSGEDEAPRSAADSEFVPGGDNVDANGTGLLKRLVVMHVVMPVERHGTGHNRADEIIKVTAAAAQGKVGIGSIDSTGELGI